MVPGTRPASTVATLKFEIMANYLAQEQLKRRWVQDVQSHSEGAFVRRDQADYVTCPQSLAKSDSDLSKGVAALNPQVSSVKVQCYDQD